MQNLVAFAAAGLIVLIGALMNAPTPPPEVAPEPEVAAVPAPAPVVAANEGSPAPGSEAPSGG